MQMFSYRQDVATKLKACCNYLANNEADPLITVLLQECFHMQLGSVMLRAFDRFPAIDGSGGIPVLFCYCDGRLERHVIPKSWCASGSIELDDPLPLTSTISHDLPEQSNISEVRHRFKLTEVSSRKGFWGYIAFENGERWSDE